MLEKYFDVKKVLKGGELSYMQVFPNNKDGKTLFIYSQDNIDRQYVPIDDERTYVIELSKFQNACENNNDAMTELLKMLGEEVNTYYTIGNQDAAYTYDNFVELVEHYQLDLPMCALDILDAGYSIITRDDRCIMEEYMTEIQFNEMGSE